ncbi:MAG: alpha/beta hydrolase [Bacteroidota bacterium]
METIKFQNKSIAYNDEGTGKPVVLLHGFTESSKIWKNFASKLSARYRVISVDLPGHGRSATLGAVHTMEFMADAVMAVLKKLRVGKCLMVGHSMGGYVTLAFAGKYPQKLKGLCLFHSHCFADTSAEQDNRNRTIGIVNQDKFTYVAQFIPSLFPVEVHKKHSKVIKRMILQASRMDKEGVIAALEGMKNRKDQSQLLRTTELPVLFILGLKDTRVPAARIWEMISLPAVSETLLLRNTGHMGYVEEPDLTYNAILGFAKQTL